MRVMVSVCGVVVLAGAVVGCGGDDAGRPATQPRGGSPTAPSQGTSTPDTGLGEVSITVYIARLHEGNLALAPVQRSIPGGGSLGRAALEAMIRGPTPAEVEQGYTTAIPFTARVLDVKNQEGVVTVNLSAGSFPAAGSPNVGLARGQIERTLRQFPGVSRVVIQVEGVAVP
jgi:spore germination protein GerM